MTHHDPVAPYNLTDLVVVTGASASFFDRMTNMIGSLHVWEPNQKVGIVALNQAMPYTLSSGCCYCICSVIECIPC